MAEWSDELMTFARDEWVGGASAATIANMIDTNFHIHFTRNAIIGKLHRMGFTRSDAPRPDRKPRQPRTRSSFGFQRRYDFPTKPATKLLPPPNALTSPEALGFPNRIDKLFRLKSHHCRFIPGDPHTGDYFFCGESVGEGRSYCNHHWKVCHERHHGHSNI